MAYAHVHVAAHLDLCSHGWDGDVLPHEDDLAAAREVCLRAVFAVPPPPSTDPHVPATAAATINWLPPVWCTAAAAATVRARTAAELAAATPPQPRPSLHTRFDEWASAARAVGRASAARAAAWFAGTNRAAFSALVTALERAPRAWLFVPLADAPLRLQAVTLAAALVSWAYDTHSGALATPLLDEYAAAAYDYESQWLALHTRRTAGGAEAARRCPLATLDVARDYYAAPDGAAFVWRVLRAYGAWLLRAADADAPALRAVGDASRAEDAAAAKRVRCIAKRSGLTARSLWHAEVTTALLVALNNAYVLLMRAHLRLLASAGSGPPLAPPPTLPTLDDGRPRCLCDAWLIYIDALLVPHYLVAGMQDWLAAGQVASFVAQLRDAHVKWGRTALLERACLALRTALAEASALDAVAATALADVIERGTRVAALLGAAAQHAIHFESDAINELRHAVALGHSELAMEGVPPDDRVAAAVAIDAVALQAACTRVHHLEEGDDMSAKPVPYHVDVAARTAAARQVTHIMSHAARVVAQEETLMLSTRAADYLVALLAGDGGAKAQGAAACMFMQLPTYRTLAVAAAACIQWVGGVGDGSEDGGAAEAAAREASAERTQASMWHQVASGSLAVWAQHASKTRAVVLMGLALHDWVPPAWLIADAVEGVATSSRLRLRLEAAAPAAEDDKDGGDTVVHTYVSSSDVAVERRARVEALVREAVLRSAAGQTATTVMERGGVDADALAHIMSILDAPNLRERTVHLRLGTATNGFADVIVADGADLLHMKLRATMQLARARRARR